MVEIALIPVKAGQATPNCNEATYTVKGGVGVGQGLNVASDQTDAGSNDTPTKSSITDQ